jgi:hypothetical protein
VTPGDRKQIAVTSLPFWIAAAGGVLLAVTTVKSLPIVVGVLGAALFLGGVMLFFAVALRRARAEGMAVSTSLRRGARDALRFAWHLMP